MTGTDNLILTGFMGTGKTSVAQKVAERLGRPFVDMDDEIVQRAGQTIPEIFAQLGEGAFRAIESGLCVYLGQLGAGHSHRRRVPGERTNREILSSSGLVICLDCKPEGIVKRLEGSSHRPMLYGTPEARVRDLLAERRQAYAAIPYHIDTTHAASTRWWRPCLRSTGWTPQAAGKHTDRRLSCPSDPWRPAPVGRPAEFTANFHGSRGGERRARLAPLGHAPDGGAGTDGIPGDADHPAPR